MYSSSARSLTSATAAWFCITVILSLSSVPASADSTIEEQHQQDGDQVRGKQLTNLTPKVALLFLVTTHVKHEGKRPFCS